MQQLSLQGTSSLAVLMTKVDENVFIVGGRTLKTTLSV